MSTVLRTYSKRSTSSKQDLPCCRGCLATDGKLYNMQEYKLTDAFARVSGMSMKHDKLPQQLCAYCAAQVRRYAAFRAKCGRAQLCFLGGLMQNALTVEYVRSIDRVANKFTDLVLSGVNTTDIAPEEPPERLVDTDKNTSIDTNNDENTTNNDENRANNDENRTNDDKYTTNNDKNCTEYIKYVFDSNVEFKEGIPEIDLEKNAGDIEVNQVEDIGGFIVKDIAEIVKKRRRRRIGSGKKNIDGAKKPVKEKKIGKLRKQKPKKPVNQEEITNLTEEDQLRIEARKTSKASHNGEGGKDDNALDIGDHNAVDIDDNNAVCDDNQVGGVVIVKDVEEIMKMKPKPARKRIRIRKKNDGEKPERKKKKEKIVKEKKVPVFREERIYKTDSAEFESTYNVKIIVFTEEQQFSEIEERKKSSKYLSAAFHCEDCGKGYQVEGAFNNHRRKHDPSAGEYACAVCSVRFRRNYTLLLHRETHRAHIVCRECGFVSRSRTQAISHYRVHQGKIYSCRYCDKTFRTCSNYLTHLRLRHFTEHLSCDMCGEVFVGPMGVRQHKSIIHAVYSSKERKCVDCGIEFLTLDALQQHWGSATVHQGPACRMCGFDLPSAELLQAHTAEHHPACEECGQTFLDPVSCDTHYMRVHHAVPVPLPPHAARRKQTAPPRHAKGPRRYMCEHCGIMQSNKTVYLEHLRRRHENVKPYACADCNKSFCTTTQYRTHVRIHTGEWPFRCDHCSRAFTMKRNLERHILNKHLGKGEQVPCKICRRVFTTSSSMRLHVRTVHEGEPWPKRIRKRPRNVAWGKDGQGNRGESGFDAGKDGDGTRGEGPGFHAGKDVEGKRGKESEFDARNDGEDKRGKEPEFDAGKDGEEKRGKEPEFDAGKDGEEKRGKEPEFDAGKDGEQQREPEFHP